MRNASFLPGLLMVILWACFGFVGVPKARAQCDAEYLWHGYGEADDVQAGVNRLYVALPGEIRVIDTTNPAVPQILGSVYIGGEVRDMDLEGNYLYLAADDQGLIVIDVTNGLAPVITANLTGPTSAQAVAADGNRVVVLSLGDVHIFNSTNPAVPVAGSVFEDFTYLVTRVECSGTDVFLLDQSGSQLDSIVTLSTANPAAPVVTGTYQTTLSGIPTGFDRQGNILAVSTSLGVELINATNRAALTLYSTIPLTGVFFDSVTMSITGGKTLLFITDDFQTECWDITVPAAPVLASTIASWGQMNARNALLYVVDSREVAVYDFAVPAAPVERFRTTTLDADNVVAFGFSIAFTRDGDVVVRSVLNPAVPGPEILITTAGTTIDIDAVGTTLYTLAFDGTLAAYNVLNPAAPVLLGSLTLPADGESLKVASGYAYVLDDDNRLRIVSVSNPAAMTEVGSVVIPTAELSPNFSLTVENGVVALSSFSEVFLVDVRNPVAPAIARTFTSSTDAFRGVAQFDQFVAIGELGDLVKIYDVSNPASISAVTTLDYSTLPDFSVSDIASVNSVLILSGSFDGRIRFIDISNPATAIDLGEVRVGSSIGSYDSLLGMLWFSNFIDGLSGVSLPDAPRFASLPDNLTVCTGAASAQFTAFVANPLGVTRQWQRHGVNLVNGGQISGASSETLTIANPNLANLGLYRCVITSACGTTTSAVATLSIATAPSFITQPQPQSVCRDGVAVFQVTVDGTPPTFQWERESPPGSGTWVNVTDAATVQTTVTGATTNTLIIVANAGQQIPNSFRTNYRVQVSNLCATVTSNPADLRFSSRCNLADVTGIGGPSATSCPDGQLTVDDIIAFVNEFGDSIGCPGAAPCNLSDVTGIGGPPFPPDGQLTVDDIIAFVNEFGNGC